MGWAEFIAAFAVFFLSHSVPVRPPVKQWIVARIGGRGFALAYSALSLGLLVWLIGAAGRAPFVPLWERAPWQNHVTLSAIAVACLILALSVGRPNPFSFGGGAREFDPAHPGLARWMRHPLLVALAIWSLAHILPNGDLALVVLFGVLAGFALIGGRLVDRRKRRELGPEWARLSIAVAASPAWPRPRSLAGLSFRLAMAGGLYGGLIWLHPLLLGVSPLP